MNPTILLRLALLLPVFLSQAEAQDLSKLYQIKDNTFRSHVEFHDIAIPAGSEKTLADIKGPGKITYWYITDNRSFSVKDQAWYPGLVLT